MSYSINRTDGSLLVTLVDSAVDRNATDLVLIGKNVTGYGEYINENFVKILENFASTSEPNNPLTGQIWFDISENRLKVYDGNTFRIGAGPIVQGTPPLDPQQGDFWIDNLEGRLYFYDGINRYPASKAYNNTQGESGFFVESIFDSNGNTKTITKLYSGSKLLGVFSNHPEFTPGQSLGSDFTGTIKPGFTPSTLDGFKFHARSASTDAIADPLGNLLTTDDLMLTDSPNTITETLTIQNEEPLVLGINGDNIVSSTSTEFNISTTRTSQDFKLYVRPIGVGAPAIFVKASTSSIGIFNNNPDTAYAVDVTGNVKITGNLFVDGGTTSISTTNLEVEDRLIDLGKVTTPSDVTANGGGIRLLGSTNHTITWSNANDSWDSSEHVNIIAGKEYRINNVKIIDSTSLGSSVLSSSLTSVGTLTSLNVSTGSLTTRIVDNVISTLGITPNVNLVLSPQGLGTVNVDNSNISNLLDPRPGPGFEQDAATRYYVDQALGNPWEEVSDYYEMSIQDRILADTSAGTIRLVLPPTSGLSLGQFVRISDLKGTFDTHPVEIVRYREIDTTYSGNSFTDGVYSNSIISTTGTVGTPTTVPVSPTVVSYTATLTNLDTTDGLAEGTSITANTDAGALYGGTAISCKVLTVDSPTAITFKVVGVVGTVTPPVAGNVNNLTIQGVPTTTSGLGYGLEVTVTVTGAPDLYTPSNTTITIINHGYGYRTGDTVTVDGSYLGGISGANDLTFTVNHTNIFSVDDDITINDADAAFGLFFAEYANGWKYADVQVLPPNISADITGDLTGSVISQNTTLTVLDTTGVTATFTGDVIGGVNGNVNGNLSGNVTSVGDNSFSTVTINGGSTVNSSLKLAGYNQRGGVGYHGFLETTNQYSSATNANKYFRLNAVGTLEVVNSNYSQTIMSLTDGGVLSSSGGFQGNISNASLTVNGTNTLGLISGTGSITMRSGNSGLIISGFDDTGTQDQYAIQVDPGTASGNRPTTYLFGDVVVQNTSSANVNGSSFKLPTYTAAGLAARTLTFLNYGELVYNSDAKKIQAYVEDDGSGFPGWVDLH